MKKSNPLKVNPYNNFKTKNIVFQFNNEKRLSFELKDGKIDVQVFGDTTESFDFFITYIKSILEDK